MSCFLSCCVKIYKGLIQIPKEKNIDIIFLIHSSRQNPYGYLQAWRQSWAVWCEVGGVQVSGWPWLWGSWSHSWCDAGRPSCPSTIHNHT